MREKQSFSAHRKSTRFSCVFKLHFMHKKAKPFWHLENPLDKRILMINKMKHHLVNEINQLFECPYCHSNLRKKTWNSMFEFEIHYKETTCDKCFHVIRMKARYHGSGHDCWDFNSLFCKRINGKSRMKHLEEIVE